MKLEFPPTDTHFTDDSWDNYQLQVYQKALKQTHARRTAIDIGAHCGIMTRRMANDFETVCSFEPIWWKLLAKNTQEFDNVKLYPFALGETNSSVQMSINNTNTGASMIDASGDHSAYCLSLDYLSEEISSVDFVKIDVEGWEYQVLRGATETFEKHTPTLIVEQHPQSPTRRAVVDLLHSWGYQHQSSIRKDQIWLHCTKR